MMRNTKYVEAFCKEMRFQNYAESSIKSYGSQIGLFIKHFEDRADPRRITTEEIKDWLMLSTSVATHKHRHGALLLFYKYVMQQPRKLERVPLPRSERRLPKVMAREFVLSRLAKIKNTKHRALLTLAYSVGLRVSEVLNLKIQDIDSKRMMICIVQSKGAKDRMLPMSAEVLRLLRIYYAEYRPGLYLFEGQKSERYSAGSCNQLVKKYLGKGFHFHQLRHSCMTSLLERGTDLRVIQQVAGHASSKTTEIYTHVSSAMLGRIALPV